jgi:hypothetical protein
MMKKVLILFVVIYLMVQPKTIGILSYLLRNFGFNIKELSKMMGLLLYLVQDYLHIN